MKTTLIIFDKYRQYKEPYICNDVFYDIIMTYCKQHMCKICNKWISTKKGVWACYLNNTTLCFYCRHKTEWPRQ